MKKTATKKKEADKSTRTPRRKVYGDEVSICLNGTCRLRKEAGCLGFEGCPGFKGR